MNILFVENAIRPSIGGVERVTYSLYKGLRKKGHNCYLYYRTGDYEKVSPQDKYCEDGPNIFTQFLLCVDKWKIDVIVCQNLHEEPYRIAYKGVKNERSNVKIVSILHSNPDIWVNKNKWGHTTNKVFFKEYLRSLYFRLIKNPYVEMQKGMYELSDRYILLSDSFKSVFCKLNKVDGDKLVAIGNPCAFFDSLDLLAKENIVLVVARMAEQQKRISEILRIWKIIQRNDWKLLLVGNGQDLDFYREMSSRLDLQNIQFLGGQEHPEDYYKRAKLFMMTSIWEGYPMTLVEAQYYGCVPVVYDSFAAVFDIIKNGENGIIVPLHDRSRFAKEMESLMDDKEKLQRLSQTAIRVSSKVYSVESHLNVWVDLLSKL